MRNKSIQGLCMHSIHKIWKGRNKHKQNEADKPLSQKAIKVIRERIEAIKQVNWSQDRNWSKKKKIRNYRKKIIDHNTIKYIQENGK